MSRRAARPAPAPRIPPHGHPCAEGGKPPPPHLPAGNRDPLAAPPSVYPQALRALRRRAWPRTWDPPTSRQPAGPGARGAAPGGPAAHRTSPTPRIRPYRAPAGPRCDRVFLVMELLEGGELLEALLARGNYSEADTRVIFKQARGRPRQARRSAAPGGAQAGASALRWEPTIGGGPQGPPSLLRRRPAPRAPLCRAGRLPLPREPPPLRFCGGPQTRFLVRAKSYGRRARLTSPSFRPFAPALRPKRSSRVSSTSTPWTSSTGARRPPPGHAPQRSRLAVFAGATLPNASKLTRGVRTARNCSLSNRRDVKLENLMLGSPGDLSSIRLIDFGLARSVDRATPSEKGRICGTPSYLAPEVIQGGHYLPAVDCWAAGVILYILLSGCGVFFNSSLPPDTRTHGHGGGERLTMRILNMSADVSAACPPGWCRSSSRARSRATATESSSASSATGSTRWCDFLFSFLSATYLLATPAFCGLSLRFLRSLGLRPPSALCCALRVDGCCGWKRPSVCLTPPAAAAPPSADSPAPSSTASRTWPSPSFGASWSSNPTSASAVRIFFGFSPQIRTHFSSDSLPNRTPDPSITRV